MAQQQLSAEQQALVALQAEMAQTRNQLATVAQRFDQLTGAHNALQDFQGRPPHPQRGRGWFRAHRGVQFLVVGIENLWVSLALLLGAWRVHRKGCVT